jgi:hypothetical protein
MLRSASARRRGSERWSRASSGSRRSLRGMPTRVPAGGYSRNLWIEVRVRAAGMPSEEGTPQGPALVVRNRVARPRKVMRAAGELEIEAPRVDGSESGLSASTHLRAQATATAHRPVDEPTNAGIAVTSIPVLTPGTPAPALASAGAVPAKPRTAQYPGGQRTWGRAKAAAGAGSPWTSSPGGKWRGWRW